MPESKSRHPHKHPHQQNKTAEPHPKHPKANRAVMVTILFFALMGLGIGCFINIDNIPVLLVTTLLGGVAGWYFGNQVSKSLSKK